MANYSPIIVIGMHRSGTSMMAGVLHKLGVMMGFDLMIGDGEVNPAGYYEDRVVMKLNEDMMGVGSWDNLPPPEVLQLSHLPPPLRQELTDFIDERARLDSPWGWKDPRTTITLPFYLPLLQEPKIIICERDRWAVIDSLDKREKKKNRQECIDLHREYMRRQRLNTRLTDSFTVYYELMVAKRDLDPLVRWLGIEPTAEQFQAATDHIRPELNRSGP